MCRVLAYIGEPIQISQLLLKPDNSMVNQTFDPEDHYMIQLAGFGLATWSKGTLNEEYPLIYKGIKPPFYDRNLGSLCERHETNVLLCHVRASGYENLNYESVVNENNCHPFIFPGFRLAMAHNGGVNGFKEIRLDLLNRCKPEIVQYVEGSTDSEVVYALLMSQLDEPTKDLKVDEMIEAIKKTIKVILDVQTKHNCTGLSTLKLFAFLTITMENQKLSLNLLILIDLICCYKSNSTVPRYWLRLPDSRNAHLNPTGNNRGLCQTC